MSTFNSVILYFKYNRYWVNYKKKYKRQHKCLTNYKQPIIKINNGEKMKLRKKITKKMLKDL